MKEVDPSINATTWKVVIKDSAGSSREGSISYHDTGGRLDFTWELAGGNTVASIHVGTQAQWQQRQPWALATRAQILQRVAAETIRQKAPTSQAHIDDQAGWIHLRAANATAAAPLATNPPSPRTPPTPHSAAAPHTAMRARMAKLSLGLAAALVIAASAAIGMKGLFSIQSPTGTPLGPSIRTPQHIATIISTLEPYVPTLNRNPGEDRHTLSLFLVPVDGRSKEQVIRIAKGWRSPDLNHVRLLGGDGTTVWFDAGGSGGVDIKTHKLLGAAELRLTPAPQAPRGSPKFSSDPEVQDFLSVGVHTSTTEWLALLSPKEAAGEYRPKSRLSPLNPAEYTKVMRRFHRAELGPVVERGMREIHAPASVSADEYFNAAFLRTAAAEEPIRLQGPDSFLMAYSASADPTATLVVARVDATGKPLWRADTGIDRFKLSQIMPGMPFVAFIGTRPPVPGKVPEPILVVVNSETGVILTTSLWK